MINKVKSAFSENKATIIISTVILFASLILGFMFEPYLYSYLNPVVEEFTQKVQSGVIQLTFADIFLNNLRIIYMMFVFGIIFCFSALILAFNGFFVGYYIAISNDFWHVLMFIIPHGIFEFSSCIISCAAGFVLFNFIFKFATSLLKQNEDSFSEKLKKSLDENFAKLEQSFILFVISIILMAIAGFIEAYLTIPIAYFLISILG